jgi:hypothetical protein
MKLSLHRVDFQSHATIGTLTVDGAQFCNTLEDVDRRLELDHSLKIPGETAIPRGTYDVIVDHSAHFGRDLPHLLNVPGFEGVRIHVGNSDKDTEGCILVGQNPTNDFVYSSHATFDALFAMIQSAIQSGEPVSIKIT